MVLAWGQGPMLGRPVGGPVGFPSLWPPGERPGLAVALPGLPIWRGRGRRQPRVSGNYMWPRMGPCGWAGEKGLDLWPLGLWPLSAGSGWEVGAGLANPQEAGGWGHLWPSFLGAQPSPEIPAMGVPNFRPGVGGHRAPGGKKAVPALPAARACWSAPRRTCWDEDSLPAPCARSRAAAFGAGPSGRCPPSVPSPRAEPSRVLAPGSAPSFLNDQQPLRLQRWTEAARLPHLLAQRLRTRSPSTVLSRPQFTICKARAGSASRSWPGCPERRERGGGGGRRLARILPFRGFCVFKEGFSFLFLLFLFFSFFFW
ncbi:PREDICTED: uncharacterized protein LOC106724742 isoform X1 [Myotis brandtii]|uniref:uncharacterized protein LOC106724742 isoform X1 n=1 Tax=Myotis brandtii TaxID=109478 RepID=UPI0007040723|nr:PREDICTED: uncharacterized protein LOC106724742 isoform X1 [Myotis brandtii]